MSSNHDSSRSSPVLQLLAAALQHWIRQQCQAVDSLELQLHGSALALLRGRLEGVSLVARGVVYEQLAFARVELTSTPIRVQMGGLIKGQGLQLEEAFQIRGTVAFSGEGLQQVLTTPPWHWLGDQLAEELLGSSPLESLRLVDERLILAVAVAEGLPPQETTAVPQAVDGSVTIKAIEGGAVVHLPMDPAIHIEAARVVEGHLELEGEAQVSP